MCYITLFLYSLTLTLSAIATESKRTASFTNIALRLPVASVLISTLKNLLLTLQKKKKSYCKYTIFKVIIDVLKKGGV